MRTYFKLVNHSSAILQEKLHALLSSTLIIIILAAVLITWELEAAVYYKKLFATFDIRQLQCLLYYLGFTLFCFFGLPSFFVKFILKTKLADIGLRWPEYSLKTACTFIIFLPICCGCLWWLAQQTSFKNYYGIGLNLSFAKFVFAQFVALPIYYFAEEFFFRGFLFLILWKKLRWHALWITEFLFTIAHVAKPGLEILFAIPVGIILNLITLWSRSIVPAMVFHCTLGVFMNFVIYYKIFLN